MTSKFMFGEHSTELLQHTMSSMKEAGAKVTVETTLETRHKFVLHTVVAEFPKKTNPVLFTRPGGLL
jgi:hypothetical protein